jgi:hypothetical protein
VHGLALRVEDLGLEHDVDDDSGHGGSSRGKDGAGDDDGQSRRSAR